MKKYFVVIAITSLLFVTLLVAQKSTIPLEKRWKTVQELADKQLPESALKEVESILAQAQKEKKSADVIKAMIYKMSFTLDKNPDETSALIKDFESFTEKSSDPAEKALLHSMTAELYALIYQRDQWTINQRTELKGTVPDDIKEWTKNIYFDKISKHLSASLDNTAVLQKTDADKFITLLQKGDDSKTLQPTLFDFLGSRKIHILQQISAACSLKNPLSDTSLFADIKTFTSLPLDSTYRGSTENQVLETYQQLLAYNKQTNNIPALLYTDLQRLNYINQEKESGDDNDSLYIHALKQLEAQFSDNEAVVEVLAEKASYYQNRPQTANHLKTAYEICEQGIKRFKKYKRINLLKNIQSQITQKQLDIFYPVIARPASTFKLKVQSANIQTLQLQVFKINATAEQYFKYKHNNRNQKVIYPDNTLLETRNIEVKPNTNFENQTTPIEFKTGDFGIYEFRVRENNDSSVSERTLGAFTVTNLSYMNRITEPNLGNLYVLDRQTGHPQEQVNVTVYKNKWARNEYQLNLIKQLATDKTGLCQYPFTSNDANNVFFFSKGKDQYFSSESYSYFNQHDARNNESMKLNLFTDRSLYRPGQTVYFKGIAYQADKTNQKVANEGIAYEVTLFDANNQKVTAKSFKTNRFGSFAGEFVLPQGGLNGAYRIQSGTYSQVFWVEEYKRPTFEVKIDKPKNEVSFGNKVALSGSVKAYAGYAVGDAKVKYRIIRRPHRYCWWFEEPDKEIINGTTVSKPDGTFEVSFVPEKSDKAELNVRGQFYTYTVYADATDLKGETQKGEQSVSVGDKALFILAEVDDKIDKKQACNIAIHTETVNGEAVRSNIKYTVSRLAETTEYNEEITNKAIEPEEIYNFKVQEEVLAGNFDTDSKKLQLALGKLASGRYKIQFQTTDAYGKQVTTEKIFILYSQDDKRPPVKTYVWLQSPVTECAVGESATILFGTSTQNSMILYEVMQGNTVLESKWIPFSDEIRKFNILYKESYGAGVTVMLTFMKNEQLFTRSVTLTKKVAERKLTPALSVFRNKLQPGEKAEWTITVPETEKNKNVAELMVSMYDASLNAIRPHTWFFNPTNREQVAFSPNWTSNGNNFMSDNALFLIPYKTIKEIQLNQLNWFGLDVAIRNGMRNRNLFIRGLNSRRAGKFTAPVIKKDEEIKSQDLLMDAKVSISIADVKGNDEANGKDIADVRQAVTQEVEEKPFFMKGPKLKENNTERNLVQLRTNFNETAFFYPQLQTDAQGNVKFTFTAPESLTRWDVKMLAHTADLYFGQGEAQVVTQKDLMVQMNLPRFVRRSDKLILSANVVNLTDKTLTANVSFELIDTATDKPIKLKDAAPKAVTLAANETKAVQWELTEFSPYELVTCKVIARAGNFSDGEQKYLPVLPDKVLITESLPLTIRGNETRTFNFESLIKNSTKVDSKNLSVEFSSYPAWYAVQALPTVSEPQSENALDYFTAYYANSLAGFIANSNPKIAATFEQWRKAGGSREALLSNLEKNSELKNMLLEETPWVVAAKDETEQKRQIALLFDLNMQKNQAKQYIDKVISLQQPSGAFTWFKGMPDSRYITQEILLNWARLAKMTKSDILTDYLSSLTAALHYLDLEIAREFANLRKNNKNYEKEMSVDNMQLFYLHLRSEYPTIPIDQSAQEAVKFYTAQSEKYWTNFTLYGKAMMALVANRNGKTLLANSILKSLKENALKTDEFGMYWAKNTSGYFWNERPIAVQAAIIEAFSEISNNTADIDEMKIWLLKQKQTQRWDSPMSTVNAIYALLNRGNNWLANEGSVQIKIGNTLLQPTSTEAGTGYFKETIPVANIRPETGKITISNIERVTQSHPLNKSSNNTSIGWGAMYWQFYQDLDKVEGQSGALKVGKKLFVEKMAPTGKTLLPIEQTTLSKGDKVITRLVVSTDRNLEFVALKDLQASCFEPVNQLSGSQWKEGICYYQTTKDASTQFFFAYLPKGTYVFEYELWVNASGEYTSGITSIQCQYAPEFVSHTGGERITVR
ncbi:alpha-2-macroglobulin domain protein [Paludibacter propionicigenes WB4]|uniref:Alpha-2-macroglobulin domain protein n=1 Tax=Paludibacter propionicigenes (strain DSM 17365 / JCM 13257 / WB4) TaxID=694427 RepID=E4T3W0_PALPW|nr:alpha-2-macroglobulin family protein [Paludibacter propionicigenes]ADQ79404.1 alpha-2-macroglobulin domain protein [Paludibacter propionicigenes WB4]